MTQAVMFYPKNDVETELKRLSYFNALRITGLCRSGLAGAQQIQISLEDALLLMQADHKLFDTKYKKVENIVSNGMLAGNCLYVLGLLNDVLGKGKASPELAWYCVECSLRDGLLALPSFSVDPARKIIDIDVRKRWLQYKPVAHLWCALYHFPENLQQRPFILNLDDDCFVQFMSIAESWAQWGLSHGSKTGGPFLRFFREFREG